MSTIGFMDSQMWLPLVERYTLWYRINGRGRWRRVGVADSRNGCERIQRTLSPGARAAHTYRITRDCAERLSY